jgi:hypothetical protein
VSGRYRVVWSPNSDLLVGICHCGAEHETDDPVEVWRWLLAHPAHPARSTRSTRERGTS